MELTLVAVLIIFIAGLVLGRKAPVVLAACVALVLGVLVANNSAGEFVHTLLEGAYGLLT